MYIKNLGVTEKWVANAQNAVRVLSKEPPYVKTVEQDFLCVAAAVNQLVAVLNAEQGFHIGTSLNNFFLFL